MVGKHDASGKPVGPCKVLSASGRTVAEGKFVKGRMEGLWTFYDSHTKIAEVNYKNGERSGLYRTFMGSSFKPEFAANLSRKDTLKPGTQPGKIR